jgi:vacuolar-type H+-ATPase subunit D/Vma8
MIGDTDRDNEIIRLISVKIEQLESENARLREIIERVKQAVNLIEPYVEPKYNLNSLNEILSEVLTAYENPTKSKEIG